MTALAMLDRRDITTLRKLQQEMWEVAQPFIKWKCDILAAALPTLILYEGKPLQTRYSLEVEAELKWIDEMLKLELDRIEKRLEK